jgi:S-adenosylmethionine-dependent methyltransferase
MSDAASASLRVLDFGGLGRYTLELARRGHNVTLIDLSDGNVEQARREVGRQGLHGCLVGDVRKVKQLVNGPFDVILALGPLDYIMDAKDRAELLQDTAPSGTLSVAAFVSVCAFLQSMAENSPRLNGKIIL